MECSAEGHWVFVSIFFRSSHSNTNVSFLPSQPMTRSAIFSWRCTIGPNIYTQWSQINNSIRKFKSFMALLWTVDEAKFLRASIFFHFHTYFRPFNLHPEKWFEKSTQIFFRRAPWEKLGGRFYRVPFKSLLRVQIKRAKVTTIFTQNNNLAPFWVKRVVIW